MEVDVVCGRGGVGGCGFRGHDRYFEAKPQFMPGICPRCNGPILVVAGGTDEVIGGAFVDRVNRRIVLPAVLG